MFIGYYELENESYFNIYYKNKLGYKAWQEDTFSPLTENIYVLDFKISGKDYQERKASLEDLAKDWQNSDLSSLDWSYGELATIQNWFYNNAKKYGLLKIFKENCIC